MFLIKLKTFSCNFIKSEKPAQVFQEIFRKKFFVEHVRATTPGRPKLCSCVNLAIWKKKTKEVVNQQNTSMSISPLTKYDFSYSLH